MEEAVDWTLRLHARMNIQVAPTSRRVIVQSTDRRAERAAASGRPAFIVSDPRQRNIKRHLRSSNARTPTHQPIASSPGSPWQPHFPRCWLYHRGQLVLYYRRIPSPRPSPAHRHPLPLQQQDRSPAHHRNKGQRLQCRRKRNHRSSSRSIRVHPPAERETTMREKTPRSSPFQPDSPVRGLT